MKSTGAAVTWISTQRKPFPCSLVAKQLTTFCHLPLSGGKFVLISERLFRSKLALYHRAHCRDRVSNLACLPSCGCLKACMASFKAALGWLTKAVGLPFYSSVPVQWERHGVQSGQGLEMGCLALEPNYLLKILGQWPTGWETPLVSSSRQEVIERTLEKSRSRVLARQDLCALPLLGWKIWAFRVENRKRNHIITFYAII